MLKLNFLNLKLNFIHNVISPIKTSLDVSNFKVIFYLHNHHISITSTKINNSLLSSNINFPNDLKYIVLQLICWRQDPNKVYIWFLYFLKCVQLHSPSFFSLFYWLFRYWVVWDWAGLDGFHKIVSHGPWPLISYDLVARSGDQVRLRTSPFHLMALALIDDCWLGLFLIKSGNMVIFLILSFLMHLLGGILL